MRDTQYKGNSKNFGALQNKQNAGAEQATFYNIRVKVTDPFQTTYLYLDAAGDGLVTQSAYAYRARIHQAQKMLAVLRKQQPRWECYIRSEKVL